MKEFLANVGRAGLLVFAAAMPGCSDPGMGNENLQFGTIGEARLEVVAPLHAATTGAGELRQTLTWSSDGPWELTERISYGGVPGDENTTRSRLDPAGLAGRYGTWIRQIHQTTITPFEPLLEPLDDYPCPPSHSRLTLSVTDDTRGLTHRWTRCVRGSLGWIDETDAYPDPYAARVALAAKLLRDNALVEDVFTSSYEASYPFAEVARGEDTPIALTAPRAILNEEAWRHFWVQHAGPEATPPTVDFERDVVLVAGLGERREAGDSVEVRRVLPVGEGTVVQIALRRPGQFCSPATQNHTPYHIVVTPRVPVPITFAEPLQVNVPCG